MMEKTNTLIIGACFSGLASACCLLKKDVDYIIIEKESALATPWRNHYDRLHLHTSKRLSHLPNKKFDKEIPLYPSRQQVVNYLEDYSKEFNIRPVYNTAALKSKNQDGYWITETNNGIFQSKNIVVATGAYGNPRAIDFNGMGSFPGRIFHSSGYRTGKDFKGQKVLVVGFGNSACEIAIDLYEQGAAPHMAVRSPVNIIPRDLLGIPILEIGLILSKLPASIADAINGPILRLHFGDISKLGLKKRTDGIFQQIKNDRNIPLIDIGTIQLIRKGNIRIHGGIDHIENKTVHFSDSKEDDFDSIIAATGYSHNIEELIDLEKDRLDDLARPLGRQKYFGSNGLYFCGFCIGPTGAIREIANDAIKIAADISRKGK